MKKTFCIALLILAASAVVGVRNIQPKVTPIKGFAPQADCCGRIVSVSATGKVTAQPDIARLNFCVETKNESLETAQGENAKAVQDITTALGEHGIEEQDIKTGYYATPEYDFFGGQGFTGFRVSSQFNIKVRDIDNVGKIIDAATAAGANIVGGVEFALADRSTAYNEALTMAVASAKEKAEILCKASGADSFKIISVREGGNFTRGTSFMKTMDCAVSTAVMGGEIEVCASVSLKCELVSNDESIDLTA